MTLPPLPELPLSEGALMGIYMDFDRKADKAWSNAEYLLRFARTVAVAQILTGQRSSAASIEGNYSDNKSDSRCACRLAGESNERATRQRGQSDQRVGDDGVAQHETRLLRTLAFGVAYQGDAAVGRTAEPGAVEVVALPDAGHHSNGPFGLTVLPWYAADQMRAYGEACAAAERERCLDICEQHYLDKYPVQEITAAIRAQEKTP